MHVLQLDSLNVQKKTVILNSTMWRASRLLHFYQFFFSFHFNVDCTVSLPESILLSNESIFFMLKLDVNEEKRSTSFDNGMKKCEYYNTNLLEHIPSSFHKMHSNCSLAKSILNLYLMCIGASIPDTKTNAVC